MTLFNDAGKPRLVTCYDKPGCIDRYTVVFCGNYRKVTGGQFLYLGMNERPFHPQGFGQHGHSEVRIDRPSYRHLGKKIRFEDLPEDCQSLVMCDYRALWRDVNEFDR